MQFMYNRISNNILKKDLDIQNKPRKTVSFYKYCNISYPKKFRDNLYLAFKKIDIFGRVYIAKEGINAQVSIPIRHLKNLKKILGDCDPRLKNISLNFAIDETIKPFWVLRMKVRNRIVADGISNFEFSASDVGIPLTASQVNEMIKDPKVTIFDIRNDYEHAIGHFKNAHKMSVNSFREVIAKSIEFMKTRRNEKILMYCTGGIRCEKASAWMKHNGFRKLFYVKGGITEYVRTARKKGFPIHFIGKNFVFDRRMSEHVSNHTLSQCKSCYAPCDKYINCINDSCHILFIQCDKCKNLFRGYCSKYCKESNNNV